MHEYAESGSFEAKLTVTDNEGLTHSVTKTATPTNPTVATLSCDENGAEPGGMVGCKLKLTSRSGFKVTLVSRDCRAHGNTFRIVQPVQVTLVEDGCYAEAGTEIVQMGPLNAGFDAGTEIEAEVIAAQLDNPPALVVEEVASQKWTIRFEDGEDEDYNDLVLSVEAINP